MKIFKLTLLTLLCVFSLYGQCGPNATRKPIGGGQYSCVPNTSLLKISLLPPVYIADGGSVTCPFSPAITSGGFYFNNTAGACTLNLPTITSAYIGTRFCFRNASSRTGILTVIAPASTTIDKDGVATAAAGSVASGGAAGDSACVVAISTTQYVLYKGSGTWN